LGIKKYDLPAQPWYWGDWFKAIDVQSLPRDIRCTWFEMLGRMWESKKRGYLTINGKPLTDEELAQVLGFGTDINLMQKHLTFLEERGVFSRTKSGIIFNRRMAKDEKIRQIRSKSGKRGMESRYNKTDNKTLTNSEDESESENEDISNLSLGEQAIKIWRDVYLKNAGVVEREFVQEQITNHDYKKAKLIVMDLKANGFFNVATMRKSLNEDGTIKPKVKNGANISKGATGDELTQLIRNRQARQGG